MLTVVNVGQVTNAHATILTQRWEPDEINDLTRLVQ